MILRSSRGYFEMIYAACNNSLKIEQKIIFYFVFTSKKKKH